MKGLNFYKKANNYLGWIVFAIASFVYISTMEKTGSFWDCGEFVAGAYKLQVVHPPGAPFFNIIGRIFTLFAFGDLTKVAIMINLMSALSTAFVVLFGFWTTSAILKKLILKTEEDYNTGNIIAILGSALVAGLSITFLDSLWFSAIEGEVYALSMFFMTFVVWATMKWDADDSPTADRWLLLIAFMIGLSTGVHLLSLLAIPFTAIIYYLKKFKFSYKGVIIAFFSSFIFIGIVMKGVIAGFPSFYSIFDKLFVNTFGLPFNSGVIFFTLVVIALIVGSLYYINKNTININKKIFNFQIKINNAIIERIVLGLTFVIIGYSSFLMVPIRSEANPPINMNRPTDPLTMLSYLNREQYGARPLVSGPDYTINPQTDYLIENGRFKKVNVRDVIVKGKDKYEVINKNGKFDYVVKPEEKMFFPRLGVLNDPAKVTAYRAWINPSYDIIDNTTNKKVAHFKANELAKANAYIKQQNSEKAGRYRIKDRLTWGDNISFFVNYQMGFMYFRYFMWNFSGRQNDLQATYANNEGRWKTGITPLDDKISLWGGTEWTQKDLSKKRTANKANNSFYGIPFILGLIGLFWLWKKSKKLTIAFVVMFLTAGTFFIVYGNQPPIEPRERDYVVVGSFFIFAIWLGMSVFAIFDLLKNKISGKVAAPIAIALALIAPILMGSQGWDDHNRDFRTIPVDMATNYLESVAPNGIIFTQGDNDTYPLWYAQEVEEIRTDVRVINVSLLGVDWYIDQLRYAVNDAAPLKLTFTPEMIKADRRNVIPYVNTVKDKNKYYDAKAILQRIAKEDPNLVAQIQYPYYYPTKKMSFPVSREALDQMNMTDAPDSLIHPALNVDIKKSNLLKNDLITIDIIANNINDRPIYFAISVAPSAYLGFEKYFQQEGLTYRIVPVENTGGHPTTSPIRKEVMYDNMMNKFKWGKIPENPNILLDETPMRMTQNLVNNFAKLADEYAKANEFEKAAEIVDKCLRVLPLDRVNLNYFHANLPAIYLKAGKTFTKNSEEIETGEQKIKARKLTEEIIAASRDELDYMLRVYEDEKHKYQKGEFSRKREIQEYLYLIQAMSRHYQIEDPEYSKSLAELLQSYSSKFQQ